MLDNCPAQILQGPGISLYTALWVRMAAEFIVHTAKAIIAGQRHRLLHLLDIQHLDRMPQAVVALSDEISGETIISTKPACVMNGVMEAS